MIASEIKEGVTIHLDKLRRIHWSWRRS
jgi:hypothetical protein